MRNLFTERLHLVGALQPFTPAEPASNRSAWNGLPAAVKAALVADGERALATDFPALPATLWLDYTRTGDRARFEAAYFSRRRLLNALVLAECVEHRGRFLDRIIDGLMLICEESGWQLPAHNSQVRSGPRAALADVENPIIDLFAAETAAQLAVAVNLLADQLDGVTPEIVQRVDHELHRRIFAPYLSRHFWWMGNGDEPMNNWTAWCTQNVLIASFARPLSMKVHQLIVTQAASSLDAFLKDYGEDGACEEGVLYYRHAGLCLFNAMVVLDAVAPEAFGPLWREPKIRNVSEYIMRMHVDGPRYFNFADSSAVVERCGAREYLFGKAVGSAALADFAATDWAAEKRLTQPDEINLFYRVQSAFTMAELEGHRGGVPAKVHSWLPSVGLMVVHDDVFSLAVKAGHNGESHNHNDVGSVTLYKHGKPLLIDVGVETYTKKTFSAERYDIWTMQSAWHNLPTFEGVMQRDGEQFAARDVEADLGSRTIAMDIAGAYPPEAQLRSYRRRVSLTGGQVEIVDTFDGDKAAELTLMFAEKPELADGRIVLPGFAEIILSGAGAMRLETLPIVDARLRIAWPETLYRVLIPLNTRTLELRIK